MRRRATAAAELVAKVLLWTYLWEAGLLALFRQGIAVPHSRPLAFLGPLEEEEAAEFSGMDQERRYPSSFSLRGSLSFKVRWSNAQAAAWD